MTKADQKRIRRLLIELPGLSSRKIARVFECELKEVSRIRAEMKAIGEIPEREVDEDLISQLPPPEVVA